MENVVEAPTTVMKMSHQEAEDLGMGFPEKVGGAKGPRTRRFLEAVL
jgi:ABC-type histidine transport system ATPase subunit